MNRGCWRGTRVWSVDEWRPVVAALPGSERGWGRAFHFSAYFIVQQETHTHTHAPTAPSVRRLSSSNQVPFPLFHIQSFFDDSLLYYGLFPTRAALLRACNNRTWKLFPGLGYPFRLSVSLSCQARRNTAQHRSNEKETAKNEAKPNRKDSHYARPVDDPVNDVTMITHFLTHHARPNGGLEFLRSFLFGTVRGHTRTQLACLL